MGEENDYSLELWVGENGRSRSTSPTYPGYIARAGHHGATFYQHLEFAEDLVRGRSSGPSLADAFWSVVIGEAAQTSIAQRTAIDIADLVPAAEPLQDLLAGNETQGA